MLKLDEKENLITLIRAGLDVRTSKDEQMLQKKIRRLQQGNSPKTSLKLSNID